MIQNYFEWLNDISNVTYFVTTNFLLGIFIFLTVWIVEEIIDYIELKEKVKEIEKKINKKEKRKKND